MENNKTNFSETGILWLGDREIYHKNGWRLYLAGPMLDVSIGPEFKNVQQFKCCIGILMNNQGDVDVVAVPTMPNATLGFHELIGSHWNGFVSGDYYFTRMNQGAPVIRMTCWEGPACILTEAR